jgi:transposase-like protein
LTRQALEAEMDERLGYAGGDRDTKATANERNGSRSKTVTPPSQEQFQVRVR